MKGLIGKTVKIRKAGLSVFFFCSLLFLNNNVCSADLKDISYQYTLSNFTGAEAYTWANLSIDEFRDEIYVVYQNEIKIYNSKGMLVYTFGDDERLNGRVEDVAIDKDGTIYLLLHTGLGSVVMRCNYRGEPVSRIEFKNFPQEFEGISPSSIIYREGRLYLAELLNSKKVFITDTNGFFQEGYDLGSLLKLDDYEGRPGQEKEIVGYNIDHKGNILLTVPTLFRAFVVSPDRKVQTFGEPGNTPGKFSVVTGIASDEAGNYYVSDTLKSVVMVFDKDSKFVTEFGYRGDQPDNLFAPKYILVHDDYLYISQARKRGISVFKLNSLNSEIGME